MRRLVLLALGAALAGGALFALMTASPDGGHRDRAPDVSSEPPHAEIDAASRARLERVLEADRAREPSR